VVHCGWVAIALRGIAWVRAVGGRVSGLRRLWGLAAGRTLREVGVEKVAALVVVILDVQLRELRVLHAQSTCADVEVLSVECALRVDRRVNVDVLNERLECSSLREDDNLGHSAVLGEDAVQHFDSDRIEEVGDSDKENRLRSLNLLLNGDRVAVRVLEVDGFAAKSGLDAAIILKESGGGLRSVELNEGLRLALKGQDILDLAEGLAQGGKLRLGDIERQVADMEDARGTLGLVMLIGLGLL